MTEERPIDGEANVDGGAREPSSTHADKNGAAIGSATNDATALGIDIKLVELLVCPLGGGPLRVDRATGTLISRRARLAFPVRDGIPILLPSEAEELSEHDPRLHRK